METDDSVQVKELRTSLGEIARMNNAYTDHSVSFSGE